MTTRGAKSRFDSHCSATRQGSKFRFHSALRKYGFDCWKIETLEESDDLNYIRKREYELINELNPAYNARTGGSGGWIVPEEKYESWKKKISKKSTGTKNGNSCGKSNEELQESLELLSKHLGYVPSQIKAAKTISGFPKHFTAFRGKYFDMAKRVEFLTGLPYYHNGNKSPMHKEKLKLANTGKKLSKEHKLNISKGLKNK